MTYFRCLIRSLVIVTLSQLSTSNEPKCSDNGHIKDPTDCSKFYSCKNGKIVSEFYCPALTVFNPDIAVCDWPANVNCNGTYPNGRTNDTVTNLVSSNSNQKPVRVCPEVPNSIAKKDDEIEREENDDDDDDDDDNEKEKTEKENDRNPDLEVEEVERVDNSIEHKVPTLTDNFHIVCYFTNWAWYRPDAGKFVPELIDPYLCTHINFAFTVLDYEGLTMRVHDSWADIDNKFYERVVAHKKTNPKLKVLMALGGWNDSGGDKYSRLVSSESSRKKFIDHTIPFLDKYGFDGLDLDWEYPKCWHAKCERGPDSDKPNFSLFVSELREAFNNHTRPLLLTAAVSPSKQVIDAGYDIPSLSKNFDFMNLMTYDYHGAWDKMTHHHSPLYANPNSTDPRENYFNVNYTINHWLELGAPSSKLIMGVPFYGRSFSLPSSNDYRIGTTTYGGGEAGVYTRERGYLSYYEICDNIKNKKWNKTIDEYSGPFAYEGNQWVGYDDKDHIIEKAKMIKDMKLGGAMIWALDLDDFSGSCCGVKNPLLKTLNSQLRDYTFDLNFGCP